MSFWFRRCLVRSLGIMVFLLRGLLGGLVLILGSLVGLLWSGFGGRRLLRMRGLWVAT